MKRKRITKKEYQEKLKDIDIEEFKNYFLSHNNKEVCAKYDIKINTMYRLMTDLKITFSKEEQIHRNVAVTSNTVREKYGVDFYFQAPDAQKKAREGVIKKYGCYNVFQSPHVKEKIRTTCLEKYGYEHAASSPEVKKKQQQTFVQRYGVDNYAKLEECTRRRKNTCLVKYGRIDAGQFGSVEHKKACLEKYGVTYVPYSPDIAQKQIATNMERYGVKWFSQSPLHQQRLKPHYTVGSVSFDSLPELAVWLFHKDNDIPIARASVSFLYNYKGKEHRYFPDFNINGTLVEIKGDHFFKDDGTMQNPFDHSLDEIYEAKHRCMIENNVVIWREAQYAPYLDYLYKNYDVLEFKYERASKEIEEQETLVEHQFDQTKQ